MATDKQTQAIAAVADANRTLEQKWTGTGPLWQVQSITLSAEIFDGDKLVPTGETLVFTPRSS